MTDGKNNVNWNMNERKERGELNAVGTGMDEVNPDCGNELNSDRVSWMDELEGDVNNVNYNHYE